MALFELKITFLGRAKRGTRLLWLSSKIMWLWLSGKVSGCSCSNFIIMNSKMYLLKKKLSVLDILSRSERSEGRDYCDWAARYYVYYIILYFTWYKIYYLYKNKNKLFCIIFFLHPTDVIKNKFNGDIREADASRHDGGPSWGPP